MAQTKPANPNVLKLFNQLQAQRQQLGQLGGQVPQAGGHPGVLSRILDLVSRPNYAMAGMFGHSYDVLAQDKAQGKSMSLPQMIGNYAAGFGRGLAGKDKYHFADVIQKADEAGAPGLFGTPRSWAKNPIYRGVVGFGADVLTDPTTYLGVGVTKAAPALEGYGQAAKGLEAAQQAQGALSTASSLKTAAQTAIKPTKAGTINLEFAGRPILKSETAYKPFSFAANTPLPEKIGRVALPQGLAGKTLPQTAPAEWFQKAFSTAYAHSGPLKSMMRVPQAAGLSDYLDWEKGLMGKYGRGLTNHEAATITNDMEHGLFKTGEFSDKGISYDEVKQVFQDTVKQWEKQEADAGITRAGFGDPTNIPKKFASASEYNTFKAMGKKGQGLKLQDLVDQGLHPHTNVLDVLRLRGVDHYRAMARAQYKADAIGRFGVVIPKGEKSTLEKAQAKLYGGEMPAGEEAALGLGLKQVPNQLLRDTVYAGQNVYAPEAMVRSFKNLDTAYNSSEEASQVLRQIDRAQRIWKTSVTTINPAHHFRNLLGDVFLNWEAGVNNPLDYQRSANMLLGKGKLKLGDATVDSSWLRTMYHKYGGASGFYNTEMVGSRTPGAAAQFINRGRGTQEQLRRFVAHREDFTRGANFINDIRKAAEASGAKNMGDIEKLVPHAVERVKKFNFDYGDLTNFESKYIRRIIPFYTFMRKNLPLQMEMLAMHPGKMAQVPKGFNALAQVLGTDPQHMPISEIVPGFMKDLTTVRLRGESPGHNAIYGDVPLPIEDFSRLFTGGTSQIARNFLGQTSPFIRMPVEFATQQQIQSGAPLARKQLPQYLASQNQITRNIMNMVSPKQPTGRLLPGEPFTPPNFNWQNWLLPITQREITPQVQMSELRRQQDPVQARLRQIRAKQFNKRFRRR